MKISLRWIALGIFAAIAVFLLTGEDDRSKGTPSDQLVIALNMSPIRGLDPHELNQFETAEVVANLYDRLVTLPASDPTRIEPMLAQSWTIDESGKIFTFKLREDVVFHSGNPLTAADAEYSLRRLVKMGLAPANDLTQWGLSEDNADALIRATGKYTLEVEFPEVWNSDLILYSLSSFAASIVDSKLVEANVVNGDFGRSFLQTNDAGSGPFALNVWHANYVLITEAFAQYWAGEPAMKRVLLQHIPESTSQRLQIQSGDVDIATRLSSSDLTALGENPEVDIIGALGIGFYYYALNLEDPILAKPEVREAFRYLVDYDGLSGTVMKHYGVLQQTIVPAGMPGADEANMPYSHDPAKARALIAEAGYPDGFTVIAYVTPVTPDYEIAQSLQASAAQAGITIDLRPGDHIGRLRGREYQVFVGRSGDRMPDPHAVLRSYARNPENTREANHSSLMAWRTAWDVPAEIADLVNQGAREGDAAKRAEIYSEVNERYLAASPPLVTFFQRKDARAVRADVQGYRGHPTWITSWDEVTKVRN